MESTLADTTVASTAAPTTVADTRPVDPAAEELAIAGTLHAADFDAPWTQYSPGGATTVDSEACSYRPDGAVTSIPPGSAQSGPTMQYGDTGAFESSVAYVFPDKAVAEEFIGVVSTEEWGTCPRRAVRDGPARGRLSRHLRGGDLANLGEPGRQRFEAYGEFTFTDPDGTVTRVLTVSFYRLGRTVITVHEEYGFLDKADFTAFFEGHLRGAHRGVRRVNAL